MASISIPTPADIQDIAHTINEHYDAEMIILFGSCARNEQRLGSDVDLLVVLPRPEGMKARDQARQIRRLFIGRGIPMDILVMTPGEFEAKSHTYGHIACIARESGRVIYE